MDKKKLKEKLHQYIDNLEDETALQELHEAAAAYEKVQKRDIVAPEQLKRSDESIQQADEGKTIAHDETMKRIAAWAFKL